MQSKHSELLSSAASVTRKSPLVTGLSRPTIRTDGIAVVTTCCSRPYEPALERKGWMPLAVLFLDICCSGNIEPHLSLESTLASTNFLPVFHSSRDRLFFPSLLLHQFFLSFTCPHLSSVFLRLALLVRVLLPCKVLSRSSVLQLILKLDLCSHPGL